MRILVITISDRASQGVYEDASGPEILRTLSEGHPERLLDSLIVPDERQAIFEALDKGEKEGADWIITSGGTGIGARDISPEVTKAWIEREIPGIAEMLRAESLKETSFAALSRGIAGQRGSCIVVNLPGSPRAARLGASLLSPLLEHGSEMLKGGGH